MKFIFSLFIIINLFSIKPFASVFNSNYIDVNNKFIYDSVKVNNKVLMQKARLDSFRNVLDTVVNKKIIVKGFNLDSVLSGIKVNNLLFNSFVDSVFFVLKKSNNINDVGKILKELKFLSKPYYRIDGNSVRINLKPSDDLIIKYDTIRKIDKVIYKSMYFVFPKHTKPKFNNPLIVKEIIKQGNLQFVNMRVNEKTKYKDFNKEHYEILSTRSSIKTGENRSKRYIIDIPVSDIKYLKKAGVSNRILDYRPLVPDAISAEVKIDDKFGLKQKSITLNFTFKEAQNTKVIIINNNGNKIFFQKMKDFKGTYSKKVYMNQEFTPYYFVIIRNKQMYGKKLLD